KKLQLEIHHLLLTYAQKIHAALFLLDNLDFSFYTTRGMIEKQSVDVFYNLVKNVEHIYPLTVQIGLGIGTSAQQAHSKASIALEYCKSENQHCCYLVNSQDKVRNLLESTGHDDWFRTDKEWIKNLSDKFNVSSLLLTRLSTITKRLEKSTFTAEELALELSQTIRNSRRILKQLEEKGLAKMVGEEHYNGKGRPKIVYKLLF
ncbi:MAG TPA: GTP cyclohydrolase IIa, partial [Sporolactobacillaceae bacterium]|nr:GTP cyclohydrolase IIa [Sporolactobacillaceae bacterium]